MEQNVPMSSLPECLLRDLAKLAAHLEEHLPHAKHAQLSIDNLKEPVIGVCLNVRGWESEGQN